MSGLAWLLSADNVPTHPLSYSLYVSLACGGNELVLMHQQHLKMLVHYEPSKHDRIRMEDIQYNLMHAGWQIEVHRGALRALKQASLLLESKAFDIVLDRICSVSEPLHNFLWVQGPRQNGSSRKLRIEATKIYARPVARRWRRVFRFLWWVARIPKWLPTFNEAAFRPDAMAVEHVAKRFKRAASTLPSVAGRTWG